MRTPCALCLCRLSLLLAFVASASVSRGATPTVSLDATEDECEAQRIAAEETECPPLRYICPHPDITFHLYTGKGQPIQLREQNLWSSVGDFVSGAPVKILIHDYNGNRNDQFNRVIKDGYFRRASGDGSRKKKISGGDAGGGDGSYNVVSVEWGELARAPCYARAVVSVPLVGVCVARFVRALAGAPPPLRRAPTSLHVLGFGLGAHVAARAGRCLAAESKIGRITGLDPAARGFESPAGGLQPTDALFVDVVHTGGAGRVSGHVDFFVNGGSEQPACQRPGSPEMESRHLFDNATLVSALLSETTNGKKAKKGAGQLDYHSVLGKALARLAAQDACSHALAPVYFAEALDSPYGFWARPCPPQWVRRLMRSTRMLAPEPASSPYPVLMGEDVPFSATGQLCVATRERAPFALGRRGGTGVTSWQGPAAPLEKPGFSPRPALSRPVPPTTPSRSLFYDALGLVTAFFFFYLAVRYATASPQWKTKVHCHRRRAQRSPASFAKEAQVAQWALHAVSTGAHDVRRPLPARSINRRRSASRPTRRSGSRHPPRPGARLHALRPARPPLPPRADAPPMPPTPSTPPTPTAPAHRDAQRAPRQRHASTPPSGAQRVVEQLRSRSTAATPLSSSAAIVPGVRPAPKPFHCPRHGASFNCPRHGPLRTHPEQPCSSLHPLVAPAASEEEEVGAVSSVEALEMALKVAVAAVEKPRFSRLREEASRPDSRRADHPGRGIMQSQSHLRPATPPTPAKVVIDSGHDSEWEEISPSPPRSPPVLPKESADMQYSSSTTPCTTPQRNRAQRSRARRKHDTAQIAR